MRDLSNGKTSVVEEGHFLLLGWTDKTISLILELIESMRSEGGGVIVILADEKKEDMEAEIGSQVCLIFLYLRRKFAVHN